ncbi:Putative Zinc finger protein [[Torrubiella] hemipterigena]|uniref:Putative Zinc finger protein n=1 Tax=[Torrubiella] hemipterigena TaxID=1531966 RepID=A0A0A1TQS2_9HYPO|nr:Putative Zinc finger protein [[Torrubiella] hemipterigena]
MADRERIVYSHGGSSGRHHGSRHHRSHSSNAAAAGEADSAAASHYYSRPAAYVTTASSKDPSTTRKYFLDAPDGRPREDSRTRRSTFDSTGRPPVIVTTRKRDRQPRDTRSPVRESEYYSIPASSSSKSRRPGESRSSRYTPRAPRVQHDHYDRPPVVYPSSPQHSAASIDYGDAGYKYTTVGELVKYDLDHPHQRVSHNVSSRDGRMRAPSAVPVHRYEPSFDDHERLHQRREQRMPEREHYYVPYIDEDGPRAGLRPRPASVSQRPVGHHSHSDRAESEDRRRYEAEQRFRDEQVADRGFGIRMPPHGHAHIHSHSHSHSHGDHRQRSPVRDGPARRLDVPMPGYSATHPRDPITVTTTGPREPGLGSYREPSSAGPSFREPSSATATSYREPSSAGPSFREPSSATTGSFREPMAATTGSFREPTSAATKGAAHAAFVSMREKPSSATTSYREPSSATSSFRESGSATASTRDTASTRETKASSSSKSDDYVAQAALTGLGIITGGLAKSESRPAKTEAPRQDKRDSYQEEPRPRDVVDAPVPSPKRDILESSSKHDMLDSPRTAQKKRASFNPTDTDDLAALRRDLAAMRARDDAPEREAPVRVVKDDTPPRTTREDGPPRTRREDSPPRTTREDGPSRVTRDDSPPRTRREDSPPRTRREEELPMATRENGPTRTTREDGPPRTTRDDIKRESLDGASKRLSYEDTSKRHSPEYPPDRVDEEPRPRRRSPDGHYSSSRRYSEDEEPRRRYSPQEGDVRSSRHYSIDDVRYSQVPPSSRHYPVDEDTRRPHSPENGDSRGRELAIISAADDRVVSPARDKRDARPLRGILKQPKVRFPEESNPIREGVAPHKEDKKIKDVPPGARWTKINRKIVNPEALTIGKERFEVRDDFVIVLRVLDKEEIQAYAAATQVLRERRRAGDPYEPPERHDDEEDDEDDDDDDDEEEEKDKKDKK